MAEPFSDDVAGHPNRTEKRLIFRHNAIPRSDFCTVSPFAPIVADLVTSVNPCCTDVRRQNQNPGLTGGRPYGLSRKVVS